MEPHGAGATLRHYRESCGLTLRAAAKQLMISHVSLRNYELEDPIPSAPFRAAIEKWSSGAIPASAWGMTPREERMAKRLEGVQVATSSPKEAA